MAQEQVPGEGADTYEGLLREQAGELNELRLRAGDPSLRVIEKRAAQLFADEGVRLPPATLHALFSGTKYAEAEKLLVLVRTLMSWDGPGRRCIPPANDDPVLNAWFERWAAIKRAKPPRQSPRSKPDPVIADIEALLQRGKNVRDAGALEEAEEYFRSALDLAIARRARGQEGWAWDGLGSCSWREGHHELALKFFTRADRIADETNDVLLKAWCLYNFGVYWRRRRKPAVAKKFLEQALAVADSDDCQKAAGWTHHELAEWEREQGNTRQEREHYEAAVRIGLTSQDDVLAGWSLVNAAWCAERAGDAVLAGLHFAHALEVGTRVGHQDIVGRAVEGLARTAGPTDQ